MAPCLCSAHRAPRLARIGHHTARAAASVVHRSLHTCFSVHATRTCIIAAACIIIIVRFVARAAVRIATAVTVQVAKGLPRAPRACYLVRGGGTVRAGARRQQVAVAPFALRRGCLPRRVRDGVRSYATPALTARVR